MKILRKELGSVKMVAEEADDLWTAYNLIAKGDTVSASTVRKIVKKSYSETKFITEQVKFNLQIQVKDEYAKEDSMIRVRGKNILDNEYIKIGAYHTLEIELNKPFVLGKDHWDSLALDVLRQASDPAVSADLAVVFMLEGSAKLLLVGKNVIKTSARIESSVPQKRRDPASASYEKPRIKFFNNVVDSLLKHVNFEVVRCVVIASPGSIKETFHRHMLLEAERRQLRTIIENKSRIVLVRALKDFWNMLSIKPFPRACYGPDVVVAAHDCVAIEKLLITDELFRNSDINARRKYVDLVNDVNRSGGTTYIFSPDHVSREELEKLSGIAAILRFPLPHLDII